MRALGSAAADRVAGRGEQPPRARLGLGRELRGAAEVARRGRVGAAAAGVERGLLERGRDRLVGRDRARREVPRALGAARPAAASAACAARRSASDAAW